MTSGERLFFALWPGEPERDAIESRVPDMPKGAKPVPRGNWHVTLAFLGPTDGPQRQAYEDAAGAVAARPFDLTLDRLGYFYRSGVIWLGAASLPDRLRALHADLNALLAERGFSPDTRPFTVHLTLARQVPSPGQLPEVEPMSWPVSEFCLVRSRLDGRGARYEVVRRFPLAGS